MGGGGLLPVAIKNNTIYFLFGKENELDDTPGWADFGGGQESGETSYDTALREGSEEINGLLGSVDQLRKRVKKNKIINLKFKDYSTFIFKMDYDDNIPSYYKNNYEFFSKYLPHVKHKKDNGLLEKAKIRWFSFDELKREKKEFRSFYQNIVNMIIKQEPEITRKMMKHTKTTKRKTQMKKRKTQMKKYKRARNKTRRNKK